MNLPCHDFPHDPGAVAMLPSNATETSGVDALLGVEQPRVDQETDITFRMGRPRNTRSGCQGVIERWWDEACNLGTSQPILFTRKPNKFPSQFISDVDQMKEEIIDFSRQRTRKMRIIKGLEKVMQGYFKGHIPNDVATRTGFLPGNLQVKKADQKGIIFYNTEAGQCVTHWDRDTSLLILLAGRKTVMIAPPGPTTCKFASTESNSSLYDDIDPFVKGKEGDWSWKSVDMKPNDALLIPKEYLHAVQSEKDTVAISLQVETYNDPKRYRHREKKNTIGRSTPPLSRRCGQEKSTGNKRLVPFRRTHVDVHVESVFTRPPTKST